ncbi:MAG: dihydroorotate dehydrogenase electron transfer subunit [Candidatus Eisenbacteria bacterium]
MNGAQNLLVRVVENRRLTSEILQLRMEVAPDWGPPAPGQFVQVECLPDRPFSLRRPFSIARFRRLEDRAELHLVYAPVGDGTREMARLAPGDAVTLVGPLGRGFRPVRDRVPVLVGGGRGIAPMLMLSDSFHREHPKGMILFGVRRSGQLYELTDVPFPVRIATEDGSAGFHGNVIQLLDELLVTRKITPDGHALYACGPNPMLHALSDWAARHGFPCQVSLETLFGCGFGICAGCAVPVRSGDEETSDEFGRYRFACIDGPVFEGDRIDWEGVRE